MISFSETDLLENPFGWSNKFSFPNPIFHNCPYYILQKKKRKFTSFPPLISLWCIAMKNIWSFPVEIKGTFDILVRLHCYRAVPKACIGIKKKKITVMINNFL